MNISPAIQKLVISILILAGLGYVAFTTLTGDLPEGYTDADVAPVEGQEILILANKLDTVNIDKSLFSDTIFTSLVDISVPILEESKGRVNPFAPIGTDSVVVSGPGSRLP